MSAVVIMKSTLVNKALFATRPADVPRESAGFRVEPASPCGEALSLGNRRNVSRNTLANASATRDWRIYANFAERLIGLARGSYAEEPFGVDLAETVYGLDATTIDLCLSVFPWAPFRSTEGGRQTAHAAGSARKYCQLYSYLRREGARRQRPRLVAAGAGRTRPEASLSRAPSRISRPSAAIPIRWIAPQG
jgi:hypothetical protein